MAYTKEKVISIIENGKLDTYRQGKSFLEIFWKQNNAERRRGYIFTFNGLTNKLIDVQFNDSVWYPVRYKPKQYVPKMNKIMSDLLTELKNSNE